MFCHILIFVLCLTLGLTSNKLGELKNDAEPEVCNCGELESELMRLTKIAETEDLLLPRSCEEVELKGLENGIHKIKPNKRAFDVKCFYGSAIIQHRFDGSENFDRSWKEYKQGFGNLMGEFWLGLENVYEITTFELQTIDVHFNEKRYWAKYFVIGSEEEFYATKDLLQEAWSVSYGPDKQHFPGERFITGDTTTSFCTYKIQGGFWTQGCQGSNLNGLFSNENMQTHDIMRWYNEPANYSKISLKPHDK